MDVGTQGHHRGRGSLGDAVRLGALEVHRDGGGGGLSPQSGGVARDLIFQKGDQILVADAVGHLQKANTRYSRCMAMTTRTPSIGCPESRKSYRSGSCPQKCRRYTGAAEERWHMEHLVDDGGEVPDGVVQGVA